MSKGSAYLAQLAELLNDSYNLEEFRTLCLYLNIDHESVPGTEKPSKIREFLLILGRNGRLPELLALVEKQRPQVTWPPVPADFQLPAPAAYGDGGVPHKQNRGYLVGALAVIATCCLGILAYIVVDKLPDRMRAADATREPALGPIPSATTTSAMPKEETASEAAQPSPEPTSGSFDISGMWVGQFNDAGFSEVTDYILVLEQTGRFVSGSTTPQAVANPDCVGNFILRGEVDSDLLTVQFSEDFDSFYCTFRGSAGNEKAFELVYTMADGLPALTGTWKEMFHGALPPSGEITFYKQP